MLVIFGKNAAKRQEAYNQRMYNKGFTKVFKQFVTPKEYDRLCDYLNMMREEK